MTANAPYTHERMVQSPEVGVRRDTSFDDPTPITPITPTPIPNNPDLLRQDLNLSFEVPSTWLPRKWSEAGPQENLDWFWEGYLGRGTITMLSGYPKCGKTTLLVHVLRLMSHPDGGSLGTPIAPAKVLIVSEEAGLLWSRRADEHNIDGWVLPHPFPQRPTLPVWLAFTEYLEHLMDHYDFEVLVLDTFASLAPILDENNSVEMLNALNPLRRFRNAAVLLVHHLRKSDAHSGMGGRGSNALPGFVDIILELRAYDNLHREDRRRILTAYSRFPETPPELILELSDDGLRYDVFEGPRDSFQDRRIRALVALIQAAREPLTKDDILTRWPKGPIPKPSPATLRRDLQDATQRGLIQVQGTGVRNDPFLFSPAPPSS